jgi:hypothetical protein
MPVMTVVIILLMLAGCAAQSWEKTIPPENPDYSRALNIFIASGEIDGPTQYVKDLPANDLEKLGVSFAPAGSNLAVSAGYSATHAINPPINVSANTAAAMGAGFFVLDMLDSAIYKPGTSDRVWMWVPISLANSPASAISQALDQVERGWATSIGNGYHITVITKQESERTFRIKGNGCLSGECVLNISTWPRAIQHLKAQNAPSFIYTTQNVYNPVSVFTIVPNKSPVNWAQLTFDQIRSFSAALPEWVAIYLAPKKGRNAIPVILQKGDPLYFVKPGSNTSS